MANISFNEIGNFTPNNSNNSNQVGFFTLKNDNDEAIVRFMYDSVDQFELLTTHELQVNGRSRRVSCKREGSDPIDMCPLCSAGMKISPRFYIQLIQYTKDPATGNIVAEPKVWDRGMDFAQRLKGYLDNYGPLSDMVCKVIRHGAARSMQTTFEIIPNLSKQMYPDNVFVKDTKLFEGYKALGTIVMNKSAQDLNTFLQTGAFPAPQNNATTALDDMAVFDTPLDQKVSYQTPAYQAAPQQQFTPQAPAFNPQPAATTQTRQTMPWETPQAANRPVRTY